MDKNTQSLPTIPSEKSDLSPNSIKFSRSRILFFALIIIAILIALGAIFFQNHRENNNTKKYASPTAKQTSALSSQHEKLTIYNQIATVFVIGGNYYDSSRKAVLATNSAEFYSSGSDTWTYMPPMIKSRNGAAAAVHANKIYVFGGQERNIYGGTSTVEVFDPNTNKWILRAEMPHKRQFANAVTLNEEIYVFGGSDIESNSIMDIYTPSLDIWRSGPSIPTRPNVFKVSCAAENNKIYCPSIGEYSYTLIFDPTSNKWSSIPTDGRISNSALSWSSNEQKLYAPSFEENNILNEYDPTTDTLTSKTIGTYIHRSYDGYGVVPLDYSLLLIGGTFASRPVKDVYVYNFFNSKSWEKTSPLNLGRSSATVVTLPISYTGKAINTLGLGSISGLITHNGVPVAGKKIMLTSPPDNYTLSSTTSTDKNGRYIFVALQPSLYRIGVEQEDNSNGYSIPIYKGKQEVQLEKGEKITDYNFDTTNPF